MKNNYLHQNPKQYMKGLSQEVLDIIGAEIRRKRKSQNLNLEDADCSCSISYLSKLERGKIRPSYKYLQELCKTNCINLSDLNALIQINELIMKSVKYYSRGLDDDIIQMNDQIHCFSNYKVELIEMFACVVQNKYKELDRKLNSVGLCIGSLNSLDKAIYNFMKMHSLNYHNKPLEACELFHQTITDSVDVKALLQFEFTHSVLKMGLNCYKEVFGELMKYSAYLSNERLKEITDLYIMNLIDDGLELDSIMLKSYSNEVNSHYLLVHGKYLEIQNIIPADKALFLSKNGYIEETKKMDIDSFIEEKQVIINYYILKHTSDNYSSMKYLAEVLLPTLINNQNVKKTKEFLDELNWYGSLAKKQKYVATLSSSLLNLLERASKCMH